MKVDLIFPPSNIKKPDARINSEGNKYPPSLGTYGQLSRNKYPNSNNRSYNGSLAMNRPNPQLEKPQMVKKSHSSKLNDISSRRQQFMDPYGKP